MRGIAFSDESSSPGGALFINKDQSGQEKRKSGAFELIKVRFWGEEEFVMLDRLEKRSQAR